MNNILLTNNFEDLSPSDFKFDPYIGHSLRDKVRDFADFLIRRPLYKLLYGKKFSHLPYAIDLVLPEKGMSTLAKRHLVDSYKQIKDSRILVIGCGSGWDFGSYLQFAPREIVGVDLYNFSGCWSQVQNYVKMAHLPTEVNFIQADVSQLPNLDLGEFDLICSDAVFEHCRDLEKVLKVIYELLSSQGLIYACYGPLWYCWGGDHFSGRGGIEYGYNHLLLNPATYQEYYQSNLRDEAFELQNGGRYIELDLFSHLSTQQYFDCYTKVGFQVKSLIVEFSQQAEDLNSTLIFKQLTEKFNQLAIDDFLIKSHLIILEKV